jgi:type IV pilus assembly protein PilC
MATYLFKGRNSKTGELVAGTREAVSHTVLGQDLLHEGVLLTSFVDAKKKNALSIELFAHVPVLERVLFARYFSLMLRAGLDVKNALGTLAQQTKNKTLSNSITAVKEGIEKGKTLSDSMRPYSKAFPSMFVSFVGVGEATGKLQETLEILALQLQKEYELRRAIQGGMMYPLVIVTALFAVGVAMMIFVIPKLVDIFAGFHVQLPLMTRVLLGTSSFISAYWYLVLGVVVILAVFFRMAQKTASGKLIIAKVFLMTPVVGPIMRQINIARLSRNLSSLLGSGVGFIEALEIMGNNSPNPVYANIFLGAVAYVKQGKLLSDFFTEYPKLIPPLVVSIMSVGEQTGELASVLQEVASFYEGEVDQTMKNLTSIMEPVLMIVIGLAVGALAISIISPIYSLVNVI